MGYASLHDLGHADCPLGWRSGLPVSGSEAGLVVSSLAGGCGRGSNRRFEERVPSGRRSGEGLQFCFSSEVCLFVCVRAAQRQNPSSSILRRIRENEMNKKTKYETGDLAWNVCSGRVFFFFFFFFQFPSLESDFRNHHRPHVWKPLFLANAFTISPQMTRLRVACGLRAPLASAYPPR